MESLGSVLEASSRVRVREGDVVTEARSERKVETGEEELLALNGKEGVMNPGMQAASRNWKKPGNRFTPIACRRIIALPACDFTISRTIRK